jgi:hypothetical protein
MSKKLASILAGCVLVSLFSFDAQALPLPVAVEPLPDNITLVRGGCGWGFHREYGDCVRNGTAYVPPVVVAPHVVVAPTVCPHGYYLDPSGHCVPY